MEGGVGHGGDSTAKAAEADHRGVGDEAGADNLRGAPGALVVAWRCVGALEEPAGGAEGALRSHHGNGIGDGRHHRADVTDGGRK